MNKKRRKELGDWIEKIERLKSELEMIQWYEENYYNAIPENLQGGENAMKSEDALDKIADTIMSLEEAVEAIEEII